jgi:hypothetical protein
MDASACLYTSRRPCLYCPMSDASQHQHWWLLPPLRFHTSEVSGGVTECQLAYPRPNWGQRVNGTRLPTRGGDEEVRVGPQGPNRLDA